MGWTPSGSRRSSRTSRRRRRPPSPRTTRTSRSQNHSSTLDSCAGILKVLNLTFIGLKGSIPSYCLVEINTCAPPILSHMVVGLRITFQRREEWCFEYELIKGFFLAKE